MVVKGDEFNQAFRESFYLCVCRRKENLGDGYLSKNGRRGRCRCRGRRPAASAHSTRWMVVVTSNNFGGWAGCRPASALTGGGKSSSVGHDGINFGEPLPTIIHCDCEQQFLPENGSYQDCAQVRKDIHPMWSSSIGTKRRISIG